MTKSRDLANVATALNAVTATELGYVDGVTSAIQTQLNAKAVYPSQTGNSGKVLTTDGSTTSWTASLPTQTGNTGKYLTTDGSSASWGAITTDPTPTVFLLMGA